MKDILQIVAHGYSVQLDFDVNKAEYIIMVEDKAGSGRVGVKRVPLYNMEKGEMIDSDAIFIAMVECIGFIKGAMKGVVTP